MRNSWNELNIWIQIVIIVNLLMLVLAIPVTAIQSKDKKPEPTVVPYEIEIWDNGAVVVNTSQQYINQIDEDTILITDRDFDEIAKQIMEMQDVGDE